MITTAIVQSAMELGCIYALVALALFLSFSILNIADMTTDGCFTLGCAVSAMMCLSGHPFLGIVMAMVAGVAAGYVTAFLQTHLGVPSILAGIITNTGLYTINLAVMGFSSNVSLFRQTTIFSIAKDAAKKTALRGWGEFIVAVVIVAIVGLFLLFFLKTRLGMSIRATGDNPDMVRASSINPAFTITVGLCIANALTALSGALLGQYNGSCDINLGTGMVVIGLASLIIGETLIGRKKMGRWIFGVIIGSILYRFIVALALRANMPAEAMKLISAIIVAVAIAFPSIKRQIMFYKQRLALKKKMEGPRC